MRGVAMFLLCGSALVAPRVSAQSAPERVGTVAGVVVVDSLNTPIANAMVRIGTTDSVRTDSSGRFELPRVPAGVKQIMVRAVGFEPYSQTISVNANGRAELELPLRRDVQQLRTVAVTAAAARSSDPRRALWMDGFDERRKVGNGHFISADELKSTDGRAWATEVVARVPSLRLARFNSRTVFMTSRGVISVLNQPRGDEVDVKMGAPKACYPIVIVDDLVRYAGRMGEPLLDLGSIDGTQIAAIEYYTVANLPVRFNKGGNAACGAVVIWLKS
ncbi:MAG: carboxypeptidase-like regulatory domain-containing protein [Gemmatimonadaceae bacterium]|nr:carboxypeptidase-like regulatory domain-containing protein [Gemmatimonadaceae bacterium]